MLHGSDLAKSVREVKIKIKELREAPKNFNSPAIIDFADEVNGKTAFAVNITNLRALAELAGFDKPDEVDFEKLRDKVNGKIFTLYKTMTNDPKKNKMVYSLFFAPDGK